jgi:hypothetical protein
MAKLLILFLSILILSCIIKAHGGEIKVETLSAEAAAQQGKKPNRARHRIRFEFKFKL